MSKDYKIFSIEEANDLVPWLNYQFGMIMMHMRRMEEALGDLMRLGVDPSPTMMTEKRTDTKDVRGQKRKLKKNILAMFRYFSKVRDTDVVIQDVSTGTVSFYTYFGEHPVFLTWQYGENEVKWWHEIFEDTENRKPLPRSHGYSGVQN
jgi:hypothetical protein